MKKEEEEAMQTSLFPSLNALLNPPPLPSPPPSFPPAQNWKNNLYVKNNLCMLYSLDDLKTKKKKTKRGKKKTLHAKTRYL
jgi:hypothetical protein